MMSENYDFRRFVNTLKSFIAIFFGIILLIFPKFSLVSMAIAFGVFAIIAGIVLTIFSFLIRKKNHYWYLWLTEAIIDFVAGAILLLFPEISVSFLIIIVGLWIALMGIILLLLYNISRKVEEKNTRFLVWGIISLLFGMILIFKPYDSAVAFSIIIGLFAILYGIITLYFNRQAKGMHSN